MSGRPLFRAASAVFAAFLSATPLLIPHAAQAQASPAPFTSATRYDHAQRVTGTIAPDPDSAGPMKFAALRNTYDTAGRLAKVESGELTSWQSEAIAPKNWTGFVVQQTVFISFDIFSNKIEERTVGSDGTVKNIVQISYDVENRPLCTAVRLDPAQWSSQTDACVPQLTGPNGSDRITKNIYDAAGQLIQVRKAVGTSLEQAYATYKYSANGKRIVVVDANGNKAELRYDGFDRQDRWTFPSQTRLTDPQRATFTAAAPDLALTLTNGVNAADYEQYGYDANGNRTSLRKRDGSTLTYQYDALNRMTVKVVPERSGTPIWATRDIYYGYDLRGLQLYARFDSTSGEGLTTAYDGLGRMTSSSLVMDGVTRTLGHQYDADGNRTRVTHPDAQAFSFAYDGLDRMTGAYAGTSATGTALAAIAYDNAGRRSGMTSAASDTTTYAYDVTSRLQTLTHGFIGGTGNVALSFGYNPASQITTEGRSNNLYAFGGNYNLNRPYGANGLNQYTTAGPATFAYDMNGNLTSDGSITFSYDIENRLIGATGARTATLKYDPMGRLYETSGGSAGVTRYLYDGDALVGEYADTNTLVRRYVHGSGVDEPLVWYEGAGLSDPRYLHANHQGSVIGIASAGGGLLNVNSYDPYGIPGITNLGRFQYTGQIWIPELGLYHYKARAYSPTLGRFLQTDPIGYDDQVNLYAYVGNDPINGRDPTGLCYKKDEVCDYTEEQTRSLLTGARAEATAGPQAGLENIQTNSRNGGDYDFLAGNTANDTWTFDGKKYNASEMGNFVAGFQAGAYDEKFGGFMARAAVYGAGLVDSLKKGDTDLDGKSRPSITAGMQAAQGFAASTSPTPRSANDPHTEYGRSHLYRNDADYNRRNPPPPQSGYQKCVMAGHCK